MAYNGFTIGRDVTLDIITKTGPVSFPVRLSHNVKQDTSDEKLVAADGEVHHLFIPSGWSGDIMFARAGDQADAYFALREAEYYSGINYENISITETITEKDGSTHQYRYTNVALKYSDKGTREGDKSVKGKMEWGASRCLKIV